MKSHTVVSSKPGRQKPKPKPSSEVALRLILSAPGMDADDVAAYVEDAINSYSGSLDASDPRRNVRVVRILKRAWVEAIATDATNIEDND